MEQQPACPKCGKVYDYRIQQAIKGYNCDTQIIFNILKVTCATCKHQFFASVAPTPMFKMEKKK